MNKTMIIVLTAFFALYAINCATTKPKYYGDANNVFNKAYQAPKNKKTRAPASVSVGNSGPAISEYVIFGENGVFIGAASTVYGLVGARNNDPKNKNAIYLNGKASIDGVDGDARSGGNVNLQNNASISENLYIQMPPNTLVVNGSIGMVKNQDPQLPAFPSPTSFQCPTGGPGHNGGNGASLNLTPGSYGAIQFGSGFQLTLNGAGDYFFDSFTVGAGSKIIVTSGGTRVYVCGNAGFAGVDVITPSDSNCDFYFETHGTDPKNAFAARGGSHWVGDVFAPFGGIHLGGGSGGQANSASFTGAAVGLAVDIEHGFKMMKKKCEMMPTPSPSPSPSPSPTPTPAAPKDATVIRTKKAFDFTSPNNNEPPPFGDKNINNGANRTLRVSETNRSLVAFDVSQYSNLANIKSAKLILFVSNNGSDVAPYSPSSGWPPTGGKVFFARMKDGFENWAEGNGNNYPVANNPHGTGSGVTWHCAADSNLADDTKNCAPGLMWTKGGTSVQGPKIGPAIQGNNLADGTKLVVDVTDSVRLGLGPLDKKYMTWFIYAKRGFGSVSYYSREGAKAAGKPQFAPRLEIVQ